MKKKLGIKSEDPQLLFPFEKDCYLHAMRWLGSSWVMHMSGLGSLYAKNHIPTLLNELLSIF